MVAENFVLNIRSIFLKWVYREKIDCGTRKLQKSGENPMYSDSLRVYAEKVDVETRKFDAGRVSGPEKFV